MSGTSFLWLEITGKCQLECVHCYAESGPAGSHGVMTRADWLRVLDEAAELDVGMVQFIGGEPTLHPDLSELVEYASSRGLAVEVFSNLVHVPPRFWEVFALPGVRLACSYYSDDPGQHAAITKRPSLERTRANIAEAVRRAIPLRVGVVDLADEQRSQQAVAELESLGVSEVGSDRLRQVGRGLRDEQASTDQLCGNCASGVLAITPTGEVWPCVFARWLPVGNVRTGPLGDILTGPELARVRGQLSAHFEPVEMPCVPRMCDPQCGPNCGPACSPQGTRHPCGPRGGCRQNYQHAVAPVSAEHSRR
ncbi:radical SAM/SPASM domain-containing protein [Sciscionella marina]|uniref:radical SAM/SPASM domain-containing protein n=1 Tax=Sciscionella marina TaxID=508770 RepID=UPI001969F61E|nr:radical SAM protein [Sciscionella marina]